MENTTSKPFQMFKPSETFVSTEVAKTCEIVIDLIFSFVIVNVGIVSNSIVIAVFAKQGYSESMNVSMTAIAIWDLVKCLAGSLLRMVGPIRLVSPADAHSWKNMTIGGMNYLVSFSTYVSSVLAAYIAVERCLCVSVPFLVKTLLTPKITFIAMASLSVAVFGSFAVIFAIQEVYWVYSPQWNQTVAFYRYSKFYHKHSGPLMKYYNLSGAIWPIVSFLVIIVCTAIIIFQLRKASVFRSKIKTSAAGSSTTTVSTRDKQVVKMLLVIIAIYIINLSPRIALYVAKYFIHELYFLKKYHNLYQICLYTMLMFDFINGTVNLFVFLAMSSNFKATAKELFN